MDSKELSVILHFGPTISSGIMHHQVHRIRAILRQLKLLNFAVEVIKTNFLNRMTIRIEDKDIFTCDLRNLKFNLDIEYDCVAQRAVEAVIEACKSIENNFHKLAVKDAVTKFDDSDIYLIFEVINNKKSEEQSLSEDLKITEALRDEFEGLESEQDKEEKEEDNEEAEYEQVEQVEQVEHVKHKHVVIRNMLDDPRLYSTHLYPSICSLTPTSLASTTDIN